MDGVTMERSVIAHDVFAICKSFQGITLCCA
jgi:hypothetical protein